MITYTTSSKEKQLKRLKKLADVIDRGEVALIEHIFEIEEKLEEIKNSAPNIDEILKSIPNGVGERGEKGDKGDKGERGERGLPGRDGVDGIDGKDGKDGKDGEMGVIDTATIAYLEDLIEQVKNEVKGVRQSRAGWGAHPLQIKDGNTVIDKVTRVINFGNNLSAVRSADGVVTVNATAGGGGSTVETPTGSVNGSNTSFTVSDVPQYVVADGVTYFDGAGYTYGALTVTMDVPPSQYIRAII